MQIINIRILYYNPKSEKSWDSMENPNKKSSDF